MTDTTKNILGLGIGIVLLAGAIIIYNNNRPKPKPHPDAEEDEYMTDEAEDDKPEEKTSEVGDSKVQDYTEMELLKERIYLIENRAKFKSPESEGHEEYMARMKKAIDETDTKELIFYNLESQYILADREDNILALEDRK